MNKLTLDNIILGKRGYIIGYVGPMFSGKTSEMINQYDRCMIAKEDCLFLKSKQDNRYSNKKVITNTGGHIGRKEVNATEFYYSKEILDILNNYFDIKHNLPKNIFITEAPFTDSGLIEVVRDLSQLGSNIYWDGLNQTSEGKEFPFVLDRNISSTPKNIGSLIAISDKIVPQYAVCKMCGDKYATKSQYLLGKKDDFEVGGEDKYEARCIQCWVPN